MQNALIHIEGNRKDQLYPPDGTETSLTQGDSLLNLLNIAKKKKKHHHK